MADIEVTPGQKTKSVGALPASQAKKLPGWSEYTKASKNFAEAKKASSEAKNTIKEHLKKSLVKNETISADAEIDFIVDSDGNLMVYEKIGGAKKERVRGKVLSLT